MNFEKWREKVFIFNIYSVFQYSILIHIAMLFYPGGTRLNTNNIGYSFFFNFISDLGLIKSYSGHYNTISWLLFSISMITSGISLILFYLAIKHFFNTKKQKQIINIASIFGIIIGISIIVTGLTPWDKFPELHDRFAEISFITTVITSIFYILAIFMNETYPNRYAYILTVYMLVSVVFIVIMVIVGSITTEYELMLIVTMQKVFSYTGTICGFFICYGAWKLEKTDKKN
jgi:hypothetical protein